MRKFSSYGPVNPNVHYYAPRAELIDAAYRQLVGDEAGGHYITVWAPRQTGKSWTMLEVVNRLKASSAFKVGIISMEHAKGETTPQTVLEIFSKELQKVLHLNFPMITDWKDFPRLFQIESLSQPLILIIDEFDALEEAFINKFASEFRNIYLTRMNEPEKKSGEKTYLLHGLALIGVRSVLGIENVRGSPFNVQRSVHIPNLTFSEVDGVFQWYAQETGQTIAPDVIARLYDETQGHPGLTCWFGELLTETYNPQPTQPITAEAFQTIYARATKALPNNTILNIISKAKQPPYKEMVLKLFKTEQKQEFTYDDPRLNFLYLHGVIDVEEQAENFYVKFASPFVQKRLFNYFAHELFQEMGNLYEPFEELEDTITNDRLALENLVKRYQQYLQRNKEWLLRDAPRRADLRIYEAVYHFNFYRYLYEFLTPRKGLVYPEFPTGNGKIDLILKYRGQVYGIEIKSYTDRSGYREALIQAARYGQQLGLTEIALICFVETIAEATRKTYEVSYRDQATGVTVTPLFVETGI